MSDLEALHAEAMRLTDVAFAARLHGDETRARQAFVEAFAKEREAARLVAAEEIEPTRSVLHRSAAALALECLELREAERLVSVALSGNPPAEICEELRGLLEQVNFHRHLEVRGQALAPDEFQMSIAGNAVGYGLAESGVFLTRVRDVESMLFRTAERSLGLPYRDRGGASKQVVESFDVYLSAPRAASFAVTFKVGGPEEQLALPGMASPTKPKDVVEEFMECLSLYVQEESVALKNRMEDEAYFANFTNLAKRVAPDGTAVTLVGFTSRTSGKERRLAISGPVRPRSVTTPASQENNETTLRGTLLYADSLASKNKIKIKEEDGNTETVLVPAGMMGDIVRPLWGQTVLVRAVRSGKDYLLEDIDPVP